MQVRLRKTAILIKRKPRLWRGFLYCCHVPSGNALLAAFLVGIASSTNDDLHPVQVDTDLCVAIGTEFRRLYVKTDRVFTHWALGDHHSNNLSRLFDFHRLGRCFFCCFHSLTVSLDSFPLSPEFTVFLRLFQQFFPRLCLFARW